MEPNADRHQEEKHTYLNKIFYGKGSIFLATLIGGPVGGGILIRRNFIHFGKPNRGTIAIGVTLAMMLMLFHPVLEDVSGPILVVSYISILLLWFLRFQGHALRIHEEAGGAFFRCGKQRAGVLLAGLLLPSAWYFMHFYHQIIMILMSILV